ncbi:Uncharacterized protein PPKH_4543 [Pseudomonas putida]|nr:Uncharacterized protein PPKH_4543 [Pseudomonas putida]
MQWLPMLQIRALHQLTGFEGFTWRQCLQQMRCLIALRVLKAMSGTEQPS